MPAKDNTCQEHTVRQIQAGFIQWGGGGGPPKHYSSPPKKHADQTNINNLMKDMYWEQAHTL